MMSWIFESWPWYVAGPLIALTMFALLFVGRQFGMSSNLRTMCSAMGANKLVGFFKFDWKSERWNLLVVLGAVLGGFIASRYMSDNTVNISPKIAEELSSNFGFDNAGTYYLPTEIFAVEHLAEPKTVLILFVGGLFVGFGARYAGGCTSGHAISGLSNLQWPSLIAVIGFFIGGLVMVNFIFPIIF